jgi:GDP-4-dehydro-6-deoxy-D-mannose reductase
MGDDVIEADRFSTDGFDVVDREKTIAAVAAKAPDVVYHLAAATHVGNSWDDPITTWRVNVEGTVNVCDAARRAGATRVLVVGTAEEYGAVGDGARPIAEDTPLRPASPYGASKVAAEYAAIQAGVAGGLETVRVRAFNHTGPGQAPRFLVPALAARIVEAERSGAREVAVGSLDPVRDWSDVRDVVRAYRLVMERGEAGAVYNVCSGTGVAVREIAQRLLERASCRLPLVTDPALLRPVDVPRLVGANDRLVAATGWTAGYSLDDTLAAVLDDARAAHS